MVNVLKQPKPSPSDYVRARLADLEAQRDEVPNAIAEARRELAELEERRAQRRRMKQQRRRLLAMLDSLEVQQRTAQRLSDLVAMVSDSGGPAAYWKPSLRRLVGDAETLVSGPVGRQIDVELEDTKRQIEDIDARLGRMEDDD